MGSPPRDDGRRRRVGRRSLVLAGAGASLLAAAGCARQAGDAAATSRQAVELTILPAGGFGEVLDQQVFPPAYALFREKTGITVNTLKIPENEIPEKLTTMVAGGTPPEGSYIHPQWVGSVVASGLVTSIEPYVSKDRALNVGDMFPTLLDYFRSPTTGGKLYGLAYYSGPGVTIYNRTLIERLGVKPPDQWEREGKWTWETVQEVATQLTKGTGAEKTWGWGSTTNGLNSLDVLIWGYGGDVWDKDLTRTRLGEPAAMEALQFYADLRTRYGVVAEGDEANALLGATGSTAFRTTGRVGMYFGIKDAIPALAAGAGPGFQPGVAPLPKGKSGRFDRNGPNSYMIVKDSRQPEAVYKLIAWMTTSEYQAFPFKIGGSVPVRRSQLQSGEFRRSLQPWEPFEVWKEAADVDRALPISARHIEIQQRFGAAYDQVRTGRATVKEIMQSLVPQIDILLREAKTGQR
jgi:multiple sugar transport system substrate-binding protein